MASPNIRSRSQSCSATGAVVVIVAMLAASACTYQARLYDLERGGAPIPATFKWSGSGKGKIAITLPSGETCSGEYVTIADSEIAWGTIFTAGSAVSGYAVTTAGKQRGTAIATGSSGTVLTCEYITSATSPSGYGACRDNSNHLYRLMF